MKITIVIVIILSISVPLSLAAAQVPMPPDVPTLGPANIISSGNDYTNVKIVSPMNQTTCSDEIKLSIQIEAVGLLGQFGNVGYSLDGGAIYSIRNLVKSVDDKTGYPDWYYYKTTAKASLSFTNISDGFHVFTVYYGWQYTGRFEVYAYSTVNFAVGNVLASPQIHITSPSNQSLSGDNFVALRFYLSQVQSMATNASVRYTLDGENLSVANFSKAEMGAIINKVSLFSEKIANLSDGLHFLTVNVQVYYADNWLFEDNSSVQFTVDASPPIITELTISDKTYTSQPIPLILGLNENASWIGYNLDNQGNKTVEGNTTLTGLSLGSHKIVVYANDTLGNMGKSEIIDFTIQEPANFQTTLIITAFAVSLFFVSAGLVIYSKKHKH